MLPDLSLLEYSNTYIHWLVLFNRVNEVEPLRCPKCEGRMRILSFIEDPEVIKKILRHLGLWDLKVRSPPKRASAPPIDTHLDYSDSQIPSCEDYLYRDPDLSASGGLSH